MAEQPVFWLGGKPGGKKKAERERPAAERWEAALRDACESCGYEVDQYVAAQGGFGGWLAHLDRDGERYRVFWSGKNRQLSFEQARPGGWQAVHASTEVEDTGVAGFVTAVKAALQQQAARE